MFIFFLKLTYESAFLAKWNYLIRKLACLFFLVPIWLIVPRVLSLTINTNNNIATIPIYAQQKAISEQYLSIGLAITMLSIYIAGVIIFGAWHVYCYVKISKEIKSGNLRVGADSKAKQLLNFFKEDMGIRRNIQMVYNNKIASPALIGLFKPMIILPVEEIPADELGMVLQHELIHFKRKDLWTKAFMLLTSTLHWFNPFVHLLHKEILIWSELSCDEEVVADMSYIDRKRYGETILNMLEVSSSKTQSYSVLFSGNKKNLKKRLLTVLHVKKANKSITVIAIILLVSIGLVATTTSAWASNHSPIIHDKTNDSDMTFNEYIEWLENYSYAEAVANGHSPDSEEAILVGAQEIIQKAKALSKEEQKKYMFYINNPEEMYTAWRDVTNKDVYSW